MPKKNKCLFKNKYRIESTRLKNYDYSSSGFYFVTICTNKRQMFFGKVTREVMRLNVIGRIVYNEWKRTEKIRRNILLDIFIVMPNHLHGIILIDYQMKNNRSNITKSHCNDNNITIPPTVETHCNASLGECKYKSKFGPQSNNLSAIIRGFKGAAKNKINKNYSEFNFSRQPLFYDRIIRNESELNRIRKYIIYNPIKWDLDRNKPGGLYI